MKSPASINPRLAFAILIFILIAIYAPAFFSSLHFSDSILSAPPVAHIGNASHILSRDFTIYTDGQYRPLAYLVLAAVRTIVPADHYFFWHAWMLAFHILNTALVYLLARKFTSTQLIPALIAGVFALNPIASSPVSNINQFHLLLGCTFTLGCVNCYLHFSQNKVKTSFLAALFLFLLSLFTARNGLAIGVFFLLFELAYNRHPLLLSIKRTALFLFLPLAFLPLWNVLSPNPLFYKYATTLSFSTFAFSLASVIAATGDYLAGMMFSWGFPSFLHERAEQIFSPLHVKFLFWAFFHLLVALATVYALFKRWWPALGLVFIYIGMLPYHSIALNPVQDYVAWPYLYLPLAGLAVFMGGLLELIQHSPKNYLRLSTKIIFILFIGLWGLRLGQINMLGNNPTSYWAHIAQNNPQSAKTACALGKAYLREGKISSALQTLFSPVMHDLGEPCRLMAQYYININNPLAASVHLRHGMKTEAPGLLYQDYFHVFGNLMFAIHAYDHAEDSYGKISMVNPFNTDSMKQLAHIWHRKGRVAAANRILSQAREFTPRDPSLSQIQAAFAAREQAWKNTPASRQIEPPDPAWLDYILYQNLSPAMMDKILHLSEDADLHDAIIQLEAVVILLEREKPKEASEKAKQVIEQLSGNSSACAIVSRALALAGETELAVKAGLRAIVLDSNNKMAWDCLALAYALQDKPDTIAEQFLNAIQTQPAVAVTFYYNLGMQRQRKHQHRKALEAFQQAVQANPHHYESQLAMGETLYELGQTEEAIEALRKAAEINPAMDAPFGKLGAALLSQNQILEAVKALQNAIQLNPSVALYHNNLGVCLAKQGREEEAVREYQRAIAIDPQLGRAHFNLGNSWLRVKNTGEAIKAFRETIEVNPNHPHARMNLGVVLYRQGDMDEALQVLEQQIQINPNTPQVYSFLVAMYFNLREFEKAWDIVEKAKQVRAPLDPKILNALREVSPKPALPR